MSTKYRPWVYSAAGYTLLELIIAATLGIGVISISATAIFFNRSLLLKDGARVEVNQSLRASLDIIGADIR
ncbi:MAG: prepilin-type cleavage/methylation domain-containing protein, partial [Cyanobacteria bacterium P01_E01_bin.34]